MSVKIVESPISLSDAAYIASIGFVQKISDHLIDDVKNHLETSGLIYKVTDKDYAVGFAFFSILGNILYLSGIVLLPAYQAQDTVEKVIKSAQRKTDCSVIAFRTQNLCMYKAIESLSLGLYPKRSTRLVNGGAWCGQSTVHTFSVEGIPEELKEKALVVSDYLHCSFPLTIGCYGSPLYGRKPTHKDLELQVAWDNFCNSERGDAVLSIGVLK